MSYSQLLFTSIKKTDTKVRQFPSRYIFVPTIIIAFAVSLILFYSNPYWYTWTVESTVATITMASLAFWALGVMMMFSLVITVAFFITLLQERRRENEENATVIASTLQDVIRKEIKNLDPSKFDLTDEQTKNALNLAHKAFQKQQEQIDSILDDQAEMKKKWMDEYAKVNRELQKERFEKEQAIESSKRWQKIAFDLLAKITFLKKLLKKENEQ